jgi:hypothetical protein
LERLEKKLLWNKLRCVWTFRGGGREAETVREKQRKTNGQRGEKN